MDWDDRGAVQRVLRRGERVLWMGRPQTGIRFGRRDRFKLAFALLFLGTAVAFVWTAARMPMGDAVATATFALFSAAMVLFGLYLVVGRFFVDALRRRQTVYAVTDQRLLAVGAWPWRWLRALPVDVSGPIEVEPARDGRGSLAFGRIAHAEGDEPALRFDWIERPNEVLAVIEGARRGRRSIVPPHAPRASAAEAR